MKDTETFTTGQLARRTGLTLRTLRYYDKIGLLTPRKQQAGGARRYGVDDLERLQHIQTLKYVGLTLEDIGEFLKAEAGSGWDLRNSLLAQLDVLQRKRMHTENVVKAIRRALEEEGGSGCENGWGRLADIIQAVQTEHTWGEQYRDASRLQSRMHLYDRFATNPYGWHRWVFDRLGQERNVHLLDLGCGDGSLWLRNADRIPDGWRITITDESEGMIEEARSRLKGLSPFKFLVADAQDIPFHDEQFDIVVAGNMLYHVRSIPRAIQEIHRVLKKGGCLYATTMSLRHLQEVERLGTSFDSEMKVIDRVVERFHRDNAPELLSPFFREVEPYYYEDSLRITEAEPLIDYMTATPMNARMRLQGQAMDRFRSYVETILERAGALQVTKENVLYKGRK